MYLFLLFLRWVLHGLICREKTLYCGTKWSHGSMSGVWNSFLHQMLFWEVLQWQKSNHGFHNHKLKKESVLISRKNNWIKLIFNQVFRVPLPISAGFLPTHLQDPSDSVGKNCRSFSCSHQPRLKCQTSEPKQPWQSGRIMRPPKYIRLPNAFIKYMQPDWKSRPPA